MHTTGAPLRRSTDGKLDNRMAVSSTPHHDTITYDAGTYIAIRNAALSGENCWREGKAALNRVIPGSYTDGSGTSRMDEPAVDRRSLRTELHVQGSLAPLTPYHRQTVDGSVRGCEGREVQGKLALALTGSGSSSPHVPTLPTPYAPSARLIKILSTAFRTFDYPQSRADQVRSDLIRCSGAYCCRSA
ncbi:hypothetical protein VTL71DRAFT_1761 [Oculimacula yallundae]|uniref:Uncharacterized protein n=1 Tax=Oculimacula yallundae TaxID=86028 RepID=A0ABR4CDJ6_9HELO